MLVIGGRSTTYILAGSAIQPSFAHKCVALDYSLFLKTESVVLRLKFREVSNRFWEGTRREKTRLKKLLAYFS